MTAVYSRRGSKQCAWIWERPNTYLATKRRCSSGFLVSWRPTARRRPARGCKSAKATLSCAETGTAFLGRTLRGASRKSLLLLFPPPGRVRFALSTSRRRVPGCLVLYLSRRPHRVADALPRRTRRNKKMVCPGNARSRAGTRRSWRRLLCCIRSRTLLRTP